MMLYIDPGTGSMLFTILIGVLGAAIYALRNVFMKLRFALSGGKREAVSSNTIPFVIFTDSKRYWNLFRPICEEFEKRGEKLVYMTASPDDPALQCQSKNVECQFIGEGNRAYAKLNMLSADVVLSSTPGLDVYQWKRSKDVKFYAHIPHAAKDLVFYRMFGIEYFDAVLLSGEYQAEQIRQLEAARNLPPKELPLVGQPYLDEMLKQLQAAPPAPDHETTVLLAPSWGPNGILSRFGGKAIKALLDTGHHVIVRPHPQSFTSEKELMDRLMAEFPDSDQLEWNRDNDNFLVLQRSDILISDFSGVLFDFSLVFDKPLIYADTTFDRSIYDACWLKEELWTFECLPRLGLQMTDENLPDIGKIIEKCIDDPVFRQGRDRARQETWCHIGEGAERTADYLIEKRNQLLAADGQAQ